MHTPYLAAPRHHYRQKIAASQATGSLPNDLGYFHQFHVKHDPWGAMVRGSWCGCEPDITWLHRLLLQEHAP
jgi:hypothetical protein